MTETTSPGDQAV